MLTTAERVIVPELLDFTEPERARSSLRDLVRINRYLGGYGALKSMFAKFFSAQDRFTMLDVGAASGDMGAQVRKLYPRAVVASLDRRPDHLDAAAAPKLAADAFQLPFAPRSFDVVFCSLFLHHFEDADVVRLLAGFRTVARRAVLAIDLERGPLAYHFVPATQWLFGWDAITMHDAPASVQAAFTRDELLALARRAGLERAEVRRRRPWARLLLAAPLS
jgi:SAM-dependent methyltransferase